MGRPSNKKEPKECLKCGSVKNASQHFYKSNSANHKDGRFPICKDCLKENLNFTDGLSQKDIDAVKNVLLEMNRPFLFGLWESSVEEAKKTNKDLFGLYIKNINLNHRTKTWNDSEFEASMLAITEQQVEIIDKQTEDDVQVIDNRDRDDVIRLIGYDPFEYENENDKKYLYSNLVNFLDESTLEDGFKLQAVIEIVKGFNQIDKINQAITNIISDVNNLATNGGGIKSLVDSKKNILASLIKLAEENGISVKHNNQKSKGAGTLSGIIKALKEKGIEEAEVNLFDIETSRGMRQVADISNRSIIQQLQFDENDYTSMIIEQREMLQDLQDKVSKLEEENRLLRKELIKYQREEGKGNE